jgi:hypothetical protein
MRPRPPWAVVCLVAASTACTALLGATDVPVPDVADPDAASDSGARQRIDTGVAESGPMIDGSSSSGSGSTSGGSSSSGSGASSGSASGGSDDGGVADQDGGCGPLDTADNCGACGVVCDRGTGLPTCVNTTCTYACNPGHLDCNAVNGPDSDGCECTTPTCCGTSCQTAHDDGVGDKFYDCNMLGTYTDPSAIEACQAYARGMGGDPTQCSDGWSCNGVDTQSVCYAPSGNGTDCWNYSGMNAGQVTDFSCPAGKLGDWN